MDEIREHIILYTSTMEPYSDIAPVYDYLLRHVDYQEWYEYIRSVMVRFVPDPRLVLELGCGTGRFGAKFSNDGYMILGIDKSIEMLRVARTRAYANFRIICADISNFHLSQEVDFIFSVHDTMNYLIEYDEIARVLRSASSVMHAGSVFMFDITTEYNIKRNFDGKTIRYDIRDKQVQWSNRYDYERRLVYSTLKMIKDTGITSVEEHVQRIYSIEEISSILLEEGFRIVGLYGDHTFNPPQHNTVMINFVVRRGS